MYDRLKDRVFFFHNLQYTQSLYAKSLFPMLASIPSLHVGFDFPFLLLPGGIQLKTSLITFIVIILLLLM